MQEFYEDMHNFYRNKKVIVTGGCGFIGSHVAEKLSQLDAQVTIVDDMSSGSLENIKTFKDKVTVIKADISNAAAYQNSLANSSIIFHLAAFISVPNSTIHPDACNKSNVSGTQILLELARRHSISRFIFSSSAAIYGNAQKASQEIDTQNPQSPYAWSKLMGEMYCKQYTQKPSYLKTACMRYFNVYGNRQNPHAPYAAAASTFNHAMKNNQQITIFGDGLQTRDFVPVETVVDANLFLGMLPSDFLNGTVYNIATESSKTILSLFEEINQNYPNYNKKPIFAPARPGDVLHAQADCSRFISVQKEYRTLKKQSLTYFNQKTKLIEIMG